MQTVIREWGDLMEVTGGALETKKSYWYLMDYERVHGKWKAVNADAGDFELIVRSVDNGDVVLTRLDCDEESEMLGIWMAPSGEKKRMIAEMRNKALHWGEGIGIRFTCGIVYHNIDAAEVSSCSLNFDGEGVHIYHGSSYQSRPAPCRI